MVVNATVCTLLKESMLSSWLEHLHDVTRVMANMNGSGASARLGPFHRVALVIGAAIIL